jgi:lysylphosphatidylglycerol synthetase-like protein (DUF2156 family)
LVWYYPFVILDVMRKFSPIIVSLFILLILFIPAAKIFAAPFTGSLVPCINDCDICDITTLIQNIINFFVYFAVVVATLMFAYAGFLYLTAGGKEDQISKAHKVFWNVFIGLIFVLVAWLVVDTLMKVFINPNEFQIGGWNKIC